MVRANLDLILEGNTSPVADDIAKRAGVSVASLFRYFDTLDDLRLATELLAGEEFGHLLEIEDIGNGSPAERVTNFVASRSTYCELTEPLLPYTRSESTSLPEIASNRQKLRALKRAQIEEQFADELKSFTPAARHDAVTAVTVLTSFGSWHYSRHRVERSNAQIRRAWKQSVSAILGID